MHIKHIKVYQRCVPIIVIATTLVCVCGLEVI